MKRLFVLTIAGIFTVGIAVKLAYGWGTNASCWKSGQTNYANAMAGSHGLHNGFVRAETKVGNNISRENIGFGNNFAVATAHSSGDFDARGEARSAVNGLDADDIPRFANANDNN